MTKRSNTGKVLVISAVIVFGLLGLGIFMIFHYANPWARAKVAKEMKKLETGPLALKFDSLNIDLATGHFDIRNVSFRTGDSTKSYHVQLKKLAVNGFGILVYLFKHKIVLDDIELSGPNIKLIRNLARKDSLTKSSSSPSMPAILVKKLHVHNGRFSVVNQDSTGEGTFVSGIFGVELARFEADSAKTHEYNLFDLEDLKLSLDSISINTSDSLYHLDLASVRADLAKQTVELDSFRLTPKYKKFEFGPHVGHEIDWAHMTNPSVAIRGIDFKRMATDTVFHADAVAIEGLKGLIFRDRRLPFPEKPDTKLLHQLMAGIKFKLDIDTMTLRKANIEYQEFVKQSIGPGRVSFEDLYGTFYHFTNIPSVLSQIDNTAHMDAQCKVMGQGLLKASFTFPLTAAKPFYTAKGSLGPMSLTALNPMLEYVGFLRIEQGQVIDLDFDFKYNEDSSAGTMGFEYKDLKISKVGKNSHTTEGLGENMTTFLINTFLVKTDNVRNKGKFRVGEIAFDRDKKKSLFNYWWKSLLSGFGSSTGITPSKEKIDAD